MAAKFLTGFEREISQELYSCRQCNEPITNPICHDCLGQEISNWLSLYPDVKKKMTLKIKNYIKDINNNTLDGVNCAACRKKKAALCPYCFTEAIYNLLKRNKIDRMIIMDFLHIFNFDLKHEGYIKEAAEEGLY